MDKPDTSDKIPLLWFVTQKAIDSGRNWNDVILLLDTWQESLVTKNKELVDRIDMLAHQVVVVK